MRGNKQIRQTAKTLLHLSLKDDEISAEQVQAVLRSVQAHPPRNYRAVLREYLRLVRKEIERSRATVEHAGVLPPDIVNSIEASLSAHYGRPISAVTKEEPSLIAGWRIRIGSDVYDSTIVNRLDRLARATR